MPAPQSPGHTAVGPTLVDSTSPVEVKQALRSSVASARRVRDEIARRDDDEARTDRVLDLVRARWPHPGAVIGCYLSQAPEPDTLALVSSLQSLGHRVLAPILSRRAGIGVPRPIAWAWYQGPGSLAPGFHQIPEPLGDVLPATALRGADLVIASGLAGGLDGSRVGTGGGWFDRALTQLDPDVPVWMLLNDSEVVASIAQEPHDRHMTLIVTPTRSLTTSVRE